MLPRNHPDRIQITFDDRRLVANAGLLLPATLARHLGLGNAPGRANAGDKMMTLVASALARGEAQPQGHVGLAGAAVADGDGDNERAPPAAWTQSLGTVERPGGSAAHRPEAARQGLKTGGPERHEQHGPQGEGSRHHLRQRKGLGLNASNRDVQDPDHRHEPGPEGQDAQPRQGHTGRPTITLHAFTTCEPSCGNLPAGIAAGWKSRLELVQTAGPRKARQNPGSGPVPRRSPPMKVR